MEDKEIVELSKLKVNEVGKLVKFKEENKSFKRRLLDMGLTKNVIIRIKQISPLGDPVSISLRGYELCLRKEDLNNILVEKVGEVND